MREIKFRAWDEQHKRPVQYPFVIDRGGNIFREYIGGGRVEKHCVLMQYTGLHDKNGKEIYEGDLMKYCVHYPQDFQERHPKKAYGRVAGPVLWTNGWLYLDYGGENSTDNTLLYETEAKDWEVIGNIYENPELLPPNK